MKYKMLIIVYLIGKKSKVIVNINACEKNCMWSILKVSKIIFELDEQRKFVLYKCGKFK